MANKHKGSTLDDFLDEEGLLNEVEAIAIKRVIAYKLQEAMKKKKLSKQRLAAKMRTSRSALDRLLDPENPSVTLLTIVRASNVLGKRIRITL